MPFSSMLLRSSHMVFVLLVGGVDQLLNNLVVLPALVDNGAEVLAHHVPDDQFLWCEVPKAILKPADVPEGCPTTDGLDGVAGQLGDHLHRHQIGVRPRQFLQQALVTLHHPLRVVDGGVDKRPGLAVTYSDAEGVRARIPPAQEGDGIPGADGVLMGGLPVTAARNHPVVQIVLGGTLANVAELAELFLGKFLGIALECLLKDRKLQRVAFQMEEQLVDFMVVIEAAHKLVLLGAFDPDSRVGRDHVHLDGILERPVDDGMVVEHGVGGYTLQLQGVEVLNVPGRQILQQNALLRYGRMADFIMPA